MREVVIPLEATGRCEREGIGTDFMDAPNVQDGWVKQHLENKQAKTWVLLAAWQRERLCFTLRQSDAPGFKYQLP